MFYLTYILSKFKHITENIRMFTYIATLTMQRLQFNTFSETEKNIHLKSHYAGKDAGCFSSWT